MEKHNKLIANNPKVVMLHYSLDDKLEDAAEWAASAKFPWYTIHNPEADVTGIGGLGDGEFVPEYLLLDATGAVIAKGEEDAFSMIASIK